MKRFRIDPEALAHEVIRAIRAAEENDDPSKLYRRYMIKGEADVQRLYDFLLPYIREQLRARPLYGGFCFCNGLVHSRYGWRSWSTYGEALWAFGQYRVTASRGYWFDRAPEEGNFESLSPLVALYKLHPELALKKAKDRASRLLRESPEGLEQKVENLHQQKNLLFFEWQGFRYIVLLGVDILVVPPEEMLEVFSSGTAASQEIAEFLEEWTGVPKKKWMGWFTGNLPSRENYEKERVLGALSRQGGAA